MANITVVSKIRFLAGLAPVILLIVSPVLALAFLAFGNVPSDLRDEQLAALRFAQNADSALYKMEWGRTQPDGVQIVLDQQRRFADLLDSAAHHLYTADQRAKLQTLAEAAKPALDAYRHADPHDEVMVAKMRDLHTMLTELENADEAALDQFGDAAKSRARQLVAVVVVTGVVLPMICFAMVWGITGNMRTDLRAIRSGIERVEESRAAKEPSIARAITEIDQALGRQGYPKPNPMLAEE